MACCDDFALALPDGYDTVLSENGSSLSGGERQRIPITRAILKDAHIVLLDEATANLDTEKESRIQAALLFRAVQGCGLTGRTVFPLAFLQLGYILQLEGEYGFRKIPEEESGRSTIQKGMGCP